MIAEPFCTPKELGDKLAEFGIRGYDARRCRELTKSMRKSGMSIIQGNCVRPSEAFAFLESNPTWRPWAGQKKKPKITK